MPGPRPRVAGGPGDEERGDQGPAARRVREMGRGVGQEALGEGRRESPTVRLLPSNYLNEVVDPRQKCTGEAARGLEAALLRTMNEVELFDDDTPIPPTFDIAWSTWAVPEVTV